MNQATRIRTRRVGDVAVLEVSGRLDPAFGPDPLLEAVEKLLGEGIKHYLINLSRVNFISSLGVGSLINVLRRLSTSEGRLKLLKPSFSVSRILSVSKLEGLFETYMDEEEAIRSFAPTAGKKESSELNSARE